MPYWRLSAQDDDGREHHITLRSSGSSTLAELGTELDAAGFPGAGAAVGRRGGTIADVDELVHGSTITPTGIDPPDVERRPGWYVVGLTGTSAGFRIRLSPDENHGLAIDETGGLSDRPGPGGSYAAGLRIDDHGAVVWLTPADGARVSREGRLISQSEPLEPWTAFTVDDAIAMVVYVTATDVQRRAEPVGPDVLLERRFRPALDPLPDRVAFPASPPRSSPMGLPPWVRLAVSLIGSLGFALISRQWTYAVLALVLSLGYSAEGFVTQHRHRRREAEDLAAYEAAQRQASASIAELRNEDRRRQRRSLVGPGVASLIASTRHRFLWERTPDDPDFLTATAGLATRPWRITADGSALATGIRDELSWCTPVAMSFMRAGSAAIIGPIAAGRAVARGILLELAAVHSPTELSMWLLTDRSTSGEWDWFRWLPHAHRELGACSVAVSPDQRGAAMTALRGLITARTDARSFARSGGDDRHLVLPAVVVVIDRTSLVDRRDLAELLLRGADVGVFGIVVDELTVPEGATATLRLEAHGRSASYSSKADPEVHPVFVALPNVDRCERAARAIAACAPHTAIAPANESTLRLLDEIGLADATPSDIIDRWRRVGPTTRTVVGRQGKVTMSIDLAEDGLHAVVGGTTGSGKTEFLKTLLAGLCLNNHPDDLAIVVTDFKGGVDHGLHRRLPHVVDVATNRDPRQFGRQIDLLNAELRRRQTLMARAGVAKLDLYHLARDANPTLDPIPRLIVVIDEFAELANDELGRSKLNELESITRIGRALGVHLILLTQRPGPYLSPDLEANMSLRVCFRVRTEEESKSVIGHPGAARIADGAPGRALASFNGRSPVEFQTARVACRRAALASPDRLAAVVVPFERAGEPAAVSREDEVRDDDTDLAHIVALTRRAAVQAGWTRSAVPWPAELTGHVPLAALRDLTSVDPELVPFALADDPAQQRRTPLMLSLRDDATVLVAGSRADDVVEALMTIAVSACAGWSSDDLHVYVIDLLGSRLSQLAPLPHVGGLASRNEQLADRMLRHIRDQIAELRSEMTRLGCATFESLRDALAEPVARTLLVFAGVERLSPPNGDISPLDGPLRALIEEAPGSNTTVVLGALDIKERMLRNIRRRIALAHHDPTATAPYGVPRARQPILTTDGNLWDSGSGLVGRMASADLDGAQLTELARWCRAVTPAQPTNPPLRIAEAPWPLRWAELDEIELRNAASEPLVPLGRGVVSNETVWYDPDESGPVLYVTGERATGKTNSLRAIARMAALGGWTVVLGTPGRRWAHGGDVALGVEEIRQRLLAAVPSPRLLVLLDDLNRGDHLEETFEEVIARRPASASLVVIVTADPDFLDYRTPLSLRALPRISSCLALAPDVTRRVWPLNITFGPSEIGAPRKGRAWGVLGGMRSGVQFPLCPDEPITSPTG